jgi:hypothetical protein
LILSGSGLCLPGGSGENDECRCAIAHAPFCFTSTKL